jgi:hypothetical protein
VAKQAESASHVSSQNMENNAASSRLASHQSLHASALFHWVPHMNSTAQPSVHAAWGPPPPELLLSEPSPLELSPLELSLDVLVPTAVVSLPVLLLVVVLLLSSTVVDDDDAPLVTPPELELEPGAPVESTPGAAFDPPQPIAMLSQTSTDKRMCG